METTNVNTQFIMSKETHQAIRAMWSKHLNEGKGEPDLIAHIVYLLLIKTPEKALNSFTPITRPKKLSNFREKPFYNITYQDSSVKYVIDRKILGKPYGDPIVMEMLKLAFDESPDVGDLLHTRRKALMALLA